MSFDPESILSIIFLVVLSLFLFIRRKGLKVQKIISPVLYAVMYRTKLGLKLMDKMAKKGGKFIRILGLFGIFIGFLGMIFLAFTLIQNLFSLLFVPGTVQGAAPVLPFKIKGVFYVPFIYWIVSIFIIAVVHEFFHGVMARAYNMKIKSSGFAFLCLLIPIIPAAFVEPDEKELQKRPAKEQLSVFAAGPFSNILLGFLVLLVFLSVGAPLANSLYSFEGVEIMDFTNYNNHTYPAEAAGVGKGEVIIGVDDYSIQFVSNLTAALDNRTVGENITLKTDKGEYNLTLGENPENQNKSYLGVYLQQKVDINEGFENKYGSFLTGSLLWIFGRPGRSGFLYWIYFLSLGIGLFNLIPIGPIDGGRMLNIVLQKFFKKEKAMKIWQNVSMVFFAMLIFIIVYGFFR